MADQTPIQWTDCTLNVVMGCPGCELWIPKNGVKLCYAGNMHAFRRNNVGFAPNFEVPVQFPGRSVKSSEASDLRGRARVGRGAYDKPWLDGYPRMIFISDMGDALATEIPFDYLEQEIIDIVDSDLGRVHEWQWLTKRPLRMAEFCHYLARKGRPWPNNLWAGTSITTTSTIERIRPLLDVGDDDTLRFVSVEPQFEPLDLSKWVQRLDWVIQGGLSGTTKHPFALEWAEDLRDLCARTGVPYFLKQLGASAVYGGEKLQLLDGHGGDWNEWPVALRVREMPIVLTEDQKLSAFLDRSTYESKSLLRIRLL